MKKHIFLIIFFNIFHLHGQVIQLIRNGDFEDNNGLPNDMDQIETKCNFWGRPGNSITPDYYTILPGHFRGICPLNSTPNGINDVLSLFLNQNLPYISPSNSSLCFAGFGSSEGLSQKLTNKTLKKSKIKTSFWIAPRGEMYDVNVCARLRGKKNSQTISKEIYCVNHYYDLKPLNQPHCTWYYIESPWIDLDDNEYDELLIGGSNNSAGDITGTGYTYIDDINLYMGNDCCVDYVIYQNTNSIPNKTHVENYILIKENAEFATNQNYSLKAGNYIEIEVSGQYSSNTSVEIDGASVDIEIEDCNPFTYPNSPLIEIILEPNVFTPNNDGINDELCFKVNNADACSVTIYNRWGLMVYSNFFYTTSNIVCVWDGYFNNGNQATEGTYFYSVDFLNCSDKKTSVGFCELFIGSSNRIGSNLNEYNFEFFPNPSKEYIYINERSDQLFMIEIFSAENKKVYSSDAFLSKHIININSLNLSTGFYYIRCFNNNETLFYDKLIIQ
ncbi:MAG: hypothetical protein KatS3mg035_1606 [Bacteroidia bacterium]|nr:MAG: hypothetical protein KatS3mg035_1606 [Bacteroidia bacterium]